MLPAAAEPVEEAAGADEEEPPQPANTVSANARISIMLSAFFIKTNLLIFTL